MGKSQTRRLREAANRFGRENWRLGRNVREALSTPTYQKNEDAGLVAPTVLNFLTRYSSALTYQQNELTYGRSKK